jgi:CheY-like chemotaxis protein
MRVLLVEDDPLLGDALAAALKQRGLDADWVRDGRDAQERANVGRRFYRAPGTQAPGSGLGLSIVQRIIELHRGTMRLDTPAAGRGLQVTIALPHVAG